MDEKPKIREYWGAGQQRMLRAMVWGSCLEERKESSKQTEEEEEGRRRRAHPAVI